MDCMSLLTMLTAMAEDWSAVGAHAAQERGKTSLQIEEEVAQHQVYMAVLSQDSESTTCVCVYVHSGFYV